MIYGIGVDIMAMARLEDLRGKYDDPFFTSTFTEKEFEEGVRRADPIAYFAGRFAAKEAVFKALRIDSNEFRWSDIETLGDDSGKPFVVLYGYAKELFNRVGAGRLHISLSNDGGYAAAFAICEIYTRERV